MPNFSDFAKQKLQERNNSSEAKLDLSKVTKILQDDLDRQIISQDSELRKYYDFYKALDDNKSSYQQQYVGDNKATKQGELRDKTREFFGQIKAKYPANQDAINLLEQDLTKKIAADVDERVALAVPYLMLQTITYFDQIDKIQDLEKKDHFLSQFPMRTADEYACVGGFSARLNPILMMLNAENVHLNSAHQSAVSSSNLNREDGIHQQAMMNALFGINLKDEHYLFPAGRFTSQELWQGYLNYHVKLQEQFLSQQEQIEKDVTDLAILFDKGKNALNFSKNLKEKFSLKDTDFYKYDEDFMPIIDDEKVEAELEKRASSYYPKGIDLPIILRENDTPIKDFNDFRTAEIIREILHNPTPSQSENSVALNYLWIMAVKEINNSGDILVLPKTSEANLLQMLKSNANDEEIKSFFEKQEQQSLHALEQIASSDNSILSQDKLVLIKDKLVFAKVLGKKDLLLYAARNGYVSALDILLGDDKIDVNHANEKGATALILAIQNGHLEVVEKLLEVSGIEVNKAEPNGNTALMIAAEKGHLEVVEKLLAYKNENGELLTDVNQANVNGYTALIIAAKNGHSEVVKELLADKDIDVNKANV
ncbi:MAG: ankyrin repeat domain-containing protein, partial [Pelagibacterales bacterium]|nr:ankyrin repeat domain-containing protein [Pelagibacterales bacterium]